MHCICIQFNNARLINRVKHILVQRIIIYLVILGICGQYILIYVINSVCFSLMRRCGVQITDRVLRVTELPFIYF